MRIKIEDDPRIVLRDAAEHYTQLFQFTSLSGDDNDVKTLVSLSPIFVEDSERAVCELLAHRELSESEFGILRYFIAQEISVLARQCGAQARMDGFYVIITMT